MSSTRPDAEEKDSAQIFAPLTPLPRGRHRLPRERVAEIQRQRLLAAVTTLVAEGGYAAVTITETARRAGVSPNVFYQHFATKEECFLAAYDVFAGALLQRVAAQVAPTSGWHDFVVGALRAYLSALDADPAAARAFLVEMDAAGPEARRRRREAFDAFAVLLRQRHEEIRARDSSLGPLPDRAYLGLTLGIRALVCDALEEGSEALLIDLIPDALHWVTATIHGAASAAADLREWSQEGEDGITSA